MRTFIQFTSRNMAKSSAYYLTFELKGNHFAANFPRIFGFARDYTFLPLPGFSSCIPGVALVNTDYIPIIDLSKKIGYENFSYNGTEKLMILEMEVYETFVRFAIPYDQLGDAFEFSAKKIMSSPTVGSIFEKGYIKGIYLHENEVIYILNFDKLIDIDDLIDLKIAPDRLAAR